MLIVAVVAAVALLLAPVIGGALRAQTRDEGAAGSVDLGASPSLARGQILTERVPLHSP